MIIQTRITRIQAFILLNIKIVHLYLTNSHVISIHPKAFWMSESNISTKNTELMGIYLSGNRIKYIKSGSFDSLINLEILKLNNNKLSNIDNTFIVNLNKLQYLNIAYNELTFLPTKWLPYNLQRLDIRWNAIEYISMNTFEGAYNLYWIELSLNYITIEYNTFSDLTKLTNINVYKHRLDKCTCTCKLIWYLNTKSNSEVCNNSNNKYASIREYLKEECKEHIAG